MRALSALTIASTVAGGIAAPALAAPASASVSSAAQADIDARIAAAAELGLDPSQIPLVGSDKNFVIFLWQKAKPGTHIKAAAERAFTDPDEAASTLFIVDGIFKAKALDVEEMKRKAEQDRQRLAAAAEIEWVNVPQVLLDGPSENFIFKLWEKSENSSHVQAAARALFADGTTEEQRQTFLVTGIYAASRADRIRKIEQAEQAERERLEREANLKAKASAWSAAVGSAVPEDIKNLPDREFIHEITKRALGVQVKAAAQAAFDKRDDPSAWKAFIFTGVHTAHKADLDERDRLEAVKAEQDVRKILEAAEKDGFQPTVATAARAALAGSIADRNAFLTLGYLNAIKVDQIKPADKLVVELQGARSRRCVQVAGELGSPNEGALADRAPTELWDCERGAKQVWELAAEGNGEYSLLNTASKLCLDTLDGTIIQAVCTDIPDQRWKFVENPADGTFQVRNVGTGTFVTPASSGVVNGTQLVEAVDLKSADQLWRIIDVTHTESTVKMTPGVVEIKGVASGHCMGVAPGREPDLAPARLVSCQFGQGRWELVSLGGKRYALKNGAGLCLDVKWGSVDDWAPLVQANCHLGGTEQWTFTKGDNGSYILTSVFSGKIADAFNSGTALGTPIIQFWDNGGGNQRWLVQPVTAS
ncbi:RICIN domain-containing protein [Kibdelosporangium philippinense]|uniref:RICIN domain-containing protein n=1 Tax=Kibdelosporangium philippinense TaxID=211113 RepID=A0ABS8ZPK8_9PSEU|nr:RICIN domain-containing protein [Kibdelosporangium philippinense]MCE7008875.1 RICIN domain-containing protein [Kibdelosporangium philippinense]